MLPIISSFYGNEVFVTAQPFMPFWGEVQSKAPDGSSITTYEGAEYNLLEAAATALNFTIGVSPSDSYANVSGRKYT